MAKKGENEDGNGKQGGDLIAGLHSEVMDLRQALARQGKETQDTLERHHREIQDTVTRHHEETQDTVTRHHEETDQRIGRIARMLVAVGDRLNDHERRLGGVEAKVG